MTGTGYAGRHPSADAGPPRSPPATAAPDAGRSLLAALRGLLARPLASYYLLLASVGLLLIIGLAMVFSATSVEAYVEPPATRSR